MPSLTLLLADILALIMSPRCYGLSHYCLSSNTTTLSPMEGCCRMGVMLGSRTPTYLAKSLKLYQPMALHVPP